MIRLKFIWLILLLILALFPDQLGAQCAMCKATNGSALDEGGVAAAEEVCAKTRGPVASVFQAGLLRADEGIEAVEKAVVSYGSIEMSFLERGLVILATVANVAPLMGFLGTVAGMILAFCLGAVYLLLRRIILHTLNS